MKKIAFVDNTLWGLLNFRGGIIKNLITKGYMITLIAPEDKKISLKEYKVEYIPIKLSRKGKNIIQDLKYIFFLEKIYRKNKFDIVFHYTIKPNIYGNMIAKLNKIRSVSIIPGLGTMFIKNNGITNVIKRLYKFSLKFSEEVWFLNIEDKELFVENRLVEESKIKILKGEGIDLEKFSISGKSKREKNKTVFLMVSRLIWEKGFKEYVEAAEIIKRKYKNVEFQLLGMLEENSASAIKEEVILEYQNKDIIKYLGSSNNVKKIIEECDCLVLPSFYREGVPRVLMEGAALKKVLITTNNIGCKEVVEDGYNGFLCKMKNSIDLSSKMELFLNLSSIEKENFGENGRKKMEEEFDYNKILEYYLEIVSK